MTTQKRAIVELLRRIQKLQGVVDVLCDEYGINKDELTTNGAAKSDRKPVEQLAKQVAPLTARATELRGFFSAHGPAKRSTILEETGIPLGTIGALLTEHGRKLPDGLWTWGGKEE